MQLDVDINIYCDECGTVLEYSEPWNSDVSVKPCQVCARRMWKHLADEQPKKNGYYAVTHYYYEETTGIAKYKNGKWTVVEGCEIDPTAPTFQWTEISNLVK